MPLKLVNSHILVEYDQAWGDTATDGTVALTESSGYPKGARVLFKKENVVTHHEGLGVLQLKDIIGIITEESK